MSDAQQTRTPSAGLAAAKRSRRLSDVGVLLPHDMKPAELAGFAQSVERLGFDSLWIPENSFLAGGIAAAGLALGATTDLHIGLGVLPAPTRHPATMAMEISTIAGAHPGRLTAGIGLGVPRWVHKMGLLPDKPARFMRDYLQVLRELLEGNETTAEIHGSPYRLESIRLAHPPAERVPLAIGGVGELMLQLAGRAADAAIISTLASVEYVEWATGLTRDAATAAQRLEPSRVCFLSTSIHEDGAEARRLIRPDLAFVLGAMGVCALTTPLGIDEQLRALLDGPTPLAESMPDAWIEQMAIVGTPEELPGRIEQYLASGATSLVFSPKPAARTVEVLTAVSDVLGLRQECGR